MYKKIFQRLNFSETKSFKGQIPLTSHTPLPYAGPPFDQVVKDRATYLPSFFFHYYKKPVLLV